MNVCMCGEYLHRGMVLEFHSIICGVCVCERVLHSPFHLFHLPCVALYGKWIWGEQFQPIRLVWDDGGGRGVCLEEAVYSGLGGVCRGWGQTIRLVFENEWYAAGVVEIVVCRRVCVRDCLGPELIYLKGKVDHSRENLKYKPGENNISNNAMWVALCI